MDEKPPWDQDPGDDWNSQALRTNKLVNNPQEPASKFPFNVSHFSDKEFSGGSKCLPKPHQII